MNAGVSYAEAGTALARENKYNCFEMGYCLTCWRTHKEASVARAEGRRVGMVEKDGDSLGPHHIELLGQEMALTWG